MKQVHLLILMEIRKRKQVQASEYIPDDQKKVLIERMNEKIKQIVTRANSLMDNI